VFPNVANIFWCNNSENQLEISYHTLFAKSSADENCFELLKKKTKLAAMKQSHSRSCQSQYWKSLREHQSQLVFQARPATVWILSVPISPCVEGLVPGEVTGTFKKWFPPGVLGH
jgi:hypothetical protein